MRCSKLYLAIASTLLLALSASAGRFSDHHQEYLTRKQQIKAKAQTEDTALPESSYRYLNAQTSPYRVKSLPDVKFDIGEMYSGLLPINITEPSRSLFFVWQPTIGAPVDEVTIWLNGGPGCSSLIGFLQENGRFLWQPGTYAPVVNQFAWVNETNMLYVEQPVGTGFTQGTPTATTQEETAQDFVKFFKNFQKTFGIKNYKIYVTGESYAGRYVPYISAAMLDEKDTEYFDLSGKYWIALLDRCTIMGALIYDGVIGNFLYTQYEAPVVPFVQKNPNLFNFKPSYMGILQQKYKQCGYAELFDKYFTFPPPGHQPAKYFNATKEKNCDVYEDVFLTALSINPCFNIYDANAACPFLDDVLSFPTTFSIETYPTYFNRKDVKKALHAPQDVDWSVCSGPVYVGGPKVGNSYLGGPEGEGDLSADPIQKVLPQVIERTNRVLVANGDYDMIVITDGTLLAIQNMTWNGKLGFQTKPHAPFRVPFPDLQYKDIFEANGYETFWDMPQGIMGTQHYERGLQWVETFQSGHEVPQYQARAAFRHLQWVLKRIDHL